MAGRPAPAPRTVPEVSLHLLTGIDVGGLGLLARGDELQIPAELFPAYLAPSLASYLAAPPEDQARRGSRVWLGSLQRHDAVVRPVPEAIVCLHPNLIYGHFLLEVLPRLLVADELLPDDVPVLAPGRGFAWVRDIIAHAMPDRPLVTWDQNTERVHVDRLWSVSHCFSDHGMHTAARDGFARLVRRITAARARSGTEPLPGGARLYLSRARLTSGWHRIADEAAIEDAMRDLGFDIVHPQELALGVQIAIMQRASVVAAEYSSALHNTVFCNPGTRVVALNRINAYQDHIGACLAQPNAYIRPDGGEFVVRQVGHPIAIPFDPRRVADTVSQIIGPP